jgi:hypothetical protein
MPLSPQMRDKLAAHLGALAGATIKMTGSALCAKSIHGSGAIDPSIAHERKGETE